MDIIYAKLDTEYNIKFKNNVSVIATYTKITSIKPGTFNIILEFSSDKEIIFKKKLLQQFVSWRLGWENKNNIISEKIINEKIEENMLLDEDIILKDSPLKGDTMENSPKDLENDSYGKIPENSPEKFTQEENLSKSLINNRNIPISIKEICKLKVYIVSNSVPVNVTDVILGFSDNQYEFINVETIISNSNIENNFIFDKAIENGYLEDSSDEDEEFEIDPEINEEERFFKKKQSQKNGKDIEILKNNFYIPDLNQETSTKLYMDMLEENSESFNSFRNILFIVFLIFITYFVYNKFTKTDDGKDDNIKE
jgi:hypothetical protein